MKSKLFFGFICLLCSIITFSISAQILGDVDQSGVVDIVDALLISQYYVGLDPVNFDFSLADVDCSSAVDIVDALNIARYFVGLIPEFTCSAGSGSAGASFSFWPQAISTADSVYFYGLASYSIGSSIVDYSWDFWDNTTGTGGTVSHSYSRASKYPVTLTVTDDDGFISSLTRVVWVGQNPPDFAPPLAVNGTQIVDANGTPFVPKAVAVVDSLSYTPDDFKYLKKEWKVDAIRLPYITERWYYNVDNNTNRETYLTAFDNYLDWTYELGIYVLLDGWHEGGNTGNVDYHFENCKEGWNILTPRLKNRTHIIWEIYNEPYEISWDQWVPKAEELIDIILSYDPVVDIFAVPGVTWAQNFNVRSLRVNRPNVIYAAHPYPHVYNGVWDASAWDNGFGYIVNEGYAPVLVTEYSFTQDNADRVGYGEAICRYLEQKDIGSFAWIFGDWGGPKFKELNSYRNDGWQFTWEYYNGIWNP